jgi:hypothetical protein
MLTEHGDVLLRDANKRSNKRFQGRGVCVCVCVCVSVSLCKKEEVNKCLEEIR